MKPTGVKTNAYSRLICHQCYDLRKVIEVTAYDVACSCLQEMKQGSEVVPKDLPYFRGEW